jgi:hypothetical protein
LPPGRIDLHAEPNAQNHHCDEEHPQIEPEAATGWQRLGMRKSWFNFNPVRLSARNMQPALFQWGQWRSVTMNAADKPPNQHKQKAESHNKAEKKQDDDSRKRGRNQISQGEVEAMRAQQGSGHS